MGTTVDLKQCILNHEREIVRLGERLNAHEKALEIARREMERRLEGMNEFREQLNHQTATFLTRTEIGLMHEKIDNDITDLKKAKNIAEGKASVASVYVAWLLAILSLIVGLLGYLK